jgi:hypothetical protein
MTSKGNKYLRIVHYADRRINDPQGAFPLSWHEFQSMRNLVLQICRRYGTIGPMELCPIQKGLSEPDIYRLWKHSEVAQPDFYVLDEQLNNERYIYIEVNGKAAFTSDFVIEISGALDGRPGWGIAVKNIQNGYLIIFGSIVLVAGPVFEGRDDLESIVAICREHLF